MIRIIFNLILGVWKKIVSLLCKCSVKRELVDLFIPNKEILVPLLEDISQVCHKILLYL